MRSFPWLPFSLLVATDLGVWLLQKQAATDASANGEGFYFAILRHPDLWLALCGAVVQLTLWRTVLRKADLSVAFPLLSISYPLALIASSVVLHESPTIGTWAGALLVMSGVMLLGSSETH